MDRILVVDDDESIRGIVCEVLRDDGFQTVEATSGEQALAAFREDDFTLVMTDIRMSGMDGITLLREIRALDAGAHVVIMTSHASLDTALNAIKMGAYDYLQKPFESLDMISQVAQRAVENARLLREREMLVATLTRNNEELAELNRFFRELSIRDGLTGLFNHRHLHEVLRSEIERAQRYRRELAVIFLDVDYFKHYNDTHGHQKGDQVLRSLAKILEGSVRQTDIVARWGGEEFVVVAPETSFEEGLRLAEKLRHTVSLYPFEGRESQPSGHVTVSVGVASLREGLDAEALVKMADMAVYRAKESGRNTVCA